MLIKTIDPLKKYVNIEYIDNIDIVDFLLAQNQ